MDKRREEFTDFRTRLMELSNDAIITVDKNGFLEIFNPAALSLFGYSPEKVPGSKGEILFESSYRETFNKYLEKYFNGELDGRVLHKDFNALHINGTVFPVTVKFSLFYEGDKKYLILLIKDISKEIIMKKEVDNERKQLLSIFESINEVIYVTDPYTYDVLYANKYFKNILGKDPIGGKCYKEFQGFDEPCGFCTNPLILKEKGKPYQWEYYNKKLDFYFLITDRIIKWPDREHARFEIAINITAQKRAELELQKHREGLERLVEERNAELIEINEDLKKSVEEKNRINREIFRQANINASLEELSKMLLKSSSIDDISYLILKEAKKFTESLYGYVGYIDPETGYLVCPTMTRDIWNECNVPHKDIVFKTRHGLWGWVLDTKKPLLSNKPQEDFRSSGVPSGHIPIENFISVPSILGENLVGQIALANSGRNYTKEDMEIIERMATIYAFAVQRKRVEEALKQSESRYSSLFSSMSEGVALHKIVYDEKGEGKDYMITDVNPSYEKILNIKREDCLGKKASQIYGTPFPPYLDKYLNVADTGIPEKFETYFAPMKKYFKVSAYSPLKQMFAVIFEDITKSKKAEKELLKYRNHLEELVQERTKELKEINEKLKEEIVMRKESETALRESEYKYRELADLLPQMVFEVDKEGKFVFANRHLIEINGYTEEDLKNSITCFDLVMPEDGEKVKDHIYERLSGKESSGVLYTGRKKDGSTFPVMVYSTAVIRDGIPVGLRGIAVDMTEQLKAEQKIKFSLKEKEVLLKEIHHRVKNNLQIISSLLNLQSIYLKDEASKDIFQESQTRVRSMALIHEILYQSRNFGEIDFSDYISRLLSYIVRSYGTNPELIINVKDIYLDIDRAISCGLIINELVSNSLKYAFGEKEKGKIRIDFLLEKEQFTLEIGDNGRGLPEDINFRETESLGLQLVTNLVEQLDGRIEIDRTIGTEFKIVFPQ